MNTLKCPKCNSEEIKQAIFAANSKLYPINSVITIGKGMSVIAEVCSKCGHILELKVNEPEKLR